MHECSDREPVRRRPDPATAGAAGGATLPQAAAERGGGRGLPGGTFRPAVGAPAARQPPAARDPFRWATGAEWRGGRRRQLCRRVRRMRAGKRAPLAAGSDRRAIPGDRSGATAGGERWQLPVHPPAPDQPIAAGDLERIGWSPAAGPAAGRAQRPAVRRAYPGRRLVLQPARATGRRRGACTAGGGGSAHAGAAPGAGAVGSGRPGGASHAPRGWGGTVDLPRRRTGLSHRGSRACPG